MVIRQVGEGPREGTPMPGPWPPGGSKQQTYIFMIWNFISAGFPHAAEGRLYVQLFVVSIFVGLFSVVII
jgi:hypothetical protein